MASSDLVISPVSNKAARKAFVELPWAIYANDPAWVPPLKGEAHDLITPGKNPFFEHAEAQFFLAHRDGQVTGRISAHFDRLALEMPVEQGMGPGTGNFGLFEATDEETAHALIAAAEQWLRGKGMTRVLGPISLSIWEEPGLLVHGHDHPPTVMMGHNSPAYEAWIESAGYTPAKKLNCFDKEAAIILNILNDAWGKNWGFVPITDSEIAFTGKKLRPIVYEDLIRIAEVDGEPVAFMMTLPDLNEAIKPLNGSLLPFGWAKLLLWLRKPQVRTMRVPLMGVVQKLQSSRMASQLAFMMIELIRRDAVAKYGATRGEMGWILEDNQGMVAITKAIDAFTNKSYQIYEKGL